MFRAYRDKMMLIFQNHRISSINTWLLVLSLMCLKQFIFVLLNIQLEKPNILTSETDLLPR